METKKSLRLALGHALVSQTDADRKVRSRAIREKLWLLPEFRRAALVFFFVSRPEEVDTHLMIDAALAEGKRVAVPAAEADFVVVPGLVFDRANRRIGHGAGFYDRFLKEIHPGTPMVALAFSFQVVKEVPQEPHDVVLDCIVTD